MPLCWKNVAQEGGGHIFARLRYMRTCKQHTLYTWLCILLFARQALGVYVECISHYGCMAKFSILSCVSQVLNLELSFGT